MNYTGQVLQLVSSRGTHGAGIITNYDFEAKHHPKAIRWLMISFVFGTNYSAEMS